MRKRRRAREIGTRSRGERRVVRAWRRRRIDGGMVREERMLGGGRRVR